MSIGFIFWLLMILWAVFGIWRAGGDRYAIGGNVLLFVLLFLLGWRVFGFIVHG